MPPEASAETLRLASLAQGAGDRTLSDERSEERRTERAERDEVTKGAKDELDTLSAGLDRLQSDEAQRPSLVREVLSKALPPIILLLALLAIWQLYVMIANPRPDKAPSPIQVASALGDAWASGRLQEAVATSLERGVIGFLIAIVIGTALGMLLAEVKVLRRAAGPLISGLQVLPSVAWVPAAIIWFGLSDATAYFVILMGAIPSIVNGLLSGIDQVPPQLRRVGTVLGASRWQLATEVVLPASLPGYFAGLKQGWAFSWRSLMAAEIITTGGSIGFGLGTMLDQSRELADLAAVLGTIILILAIGILIELVIFGPIERRMLRSRGLLLGGGK
ncbi:ABC transporter permease [Microbacterium bovistercoris]|uniref:ABC transporter permease n=1 Tax=Microbacterium bovistercoris TaxID=2293570 RepID=A0A371NPD8_9MICO|nr:ABC transporter permease [Microbacterium bovistercoris]REJ04064.1 ABC transporter permease [Microbacterium bovistercoris]